MRADRNRKQPLNTMTKPITNEEAEMVRIECDGWFCVPPKPHGALREITDYVERLEEAIKHLKAALDNVPPQCNEIIVKQLASRLHHREPKPPGPPGPPLYSRHTPQSERDRFEARAREILSQNK